MAPPSPVGVRQHSVSATGRNWNRKTTASKIKVLVLPQLKKVDVVNGIGSGRT